MRRALLTFALAAPVLAHAQNLVPGQILFAERETDVVRGRWISKAECDARATTNVELRWSTKLTTATSFTAPPANSKYQVYAANQEHNATDPEACHKAPNQTTGLVAGPVGSEIIATSFTQTQGFTLAPFVAAIPSITCNPTGDTIIYVCVEAKDGEQKSIGIARGQLTLSVTAPGAPGSVDALPGEGSLTVRWTRPDSTPEIYDARVVVKSVVAGCADAASATSTCARDPGDAAVHEATSGIRATELKVGGLVNGVLYRVEVYGRSEAGNENATPGTDTGTPLPADGFWEYYRQQPGAMEEGGCGTGRAGSIALLAVAGLLATLRRRT